MARNIVTSFGVGIAANKISSISAFDRIMKEVDTNEIPLEFIEAVLVQYYDGSVVELNNTELMHPICLNKKDIWRDIQNSYRQIRDIKIFLNNKHLEEIINPMVEDYLGKYSE